MSSAKASPKQTSKALSKGGPYNLRVTAGGSVLPRLVVRQTEDGRGKGVYTLDAIADDTLVEESHVIVFSEEDWEKMKTTNAYNYSTYYISATSFDPTLIF